MIIMTAKTGTITLWYVTNPKRRTTITGVAVPRHAIFGCRVNTAGEMVDMFTKAVIG
jgi:hypothetical protein